MTLGSDLSSIRFRVLRSSKRSALADIIHCSPWTNLRGTPSMEVAKKGDGLQLERGPCQNKSKGNWLLFTWGIC